MTGVDKDFRDKNPATKAKLLLSLFGCEKFLILV
jgi:hypothetical protein